MKVENLEDDKKIKVDNGYSEEYADDFYDETECHCKGKHQSDCEECQCEDCECEDCKCEDCKCDSCDCEDCNCEDCHCDNCECKHVHCHDYDEEELPDTLIEDFSPAIVERAEKYYDDGMVGNIAKDKNHYYAKVSGHDDNIYNVEIIVYSSEDADYFCDCPCEYPCKHAYATILAISNQEYHEVSLKENICCNVASLSETINKIPAEELKKYLLSKEGLDNVSFNVTQFNNFFNKYLPNQSYEYYYNNLYNSLIIDKNDDELVDDYIKNAREYLKDNCYGECFKIIKSIIEAFHDSEMLDVDDHFFELINKIGMLLRIVYRKAEGNIKNDIREWTDNLKKDNYYDNYYLEDVILSLN